MNYDDIPRKEVQNLRRAAFWKVTVLWRVAFVAVIVALIAGTTADWMTREFGMLASWKPVAVGVVSAGLLWVFHPVVLEPAIRTEVEKAKKSDPT